MKYWSGKFINQLKENEIFVYGSNPQGINGTGAAKSAMSISKGARHGIGRGFNGDSAFALITKNLNAGITVDGIKYEKEGYCSVSKEQIRNNIKELYSTARELQHKDKNFLITYKFETWPNGSPRKSLNGYTSQEMLEMFVKDQDIPPNIVFHDSYKPHLEKLLNKDSSPVIAKPEVSSIEEKNRRTYTFFFRSTSPFSQWHPSLFTYRDLTFISAEQFMMYAKARTFSDHGTAEKIINIENNYIKPDGSFRNDSDKACYDLIVAFKKGKIDRKTAICSKNLDTWNLIQKLFKKLGRDVKGYNDDIWRPKSKSVVGVASREKYSQNPDLYEIFMNTGDTIMVEASPYDHIWGCGLDEATAVKMEADKWPGANDLGDVLTALKIEFQKNLIKRPKI